MGGDDAFFYVRVVQLFSAFKFSKIIHKVSLDVFHKNLIWIPSNAQYAAFLLQSCGVNVFTEELMLLLYFAIFKSYNSAK